MTLQAGDLIWVEFDPAFGHEQAGRRPAVVVSVGPYNAASSFIMVCPVTSNARPWPYKVEILGTHALRGAVLVDQIKSIDKRRIVSPVAGRLSEGELEEVLGKMAAVLGIDQTVASGHAKSD